MRLLDAKSPKWAMRHIAALMALAGISVLIGGYVISLYLSEINQEILNACAEYYDQTGADCPNFVYYHDGGDSTLVFFLSIWVGCGLLFASGMYWAIRTTV